MATIGESKWAAIIALKPYTRDISRRGEYGILVFQAGKWFCHQDPEIALRELSFGPRQFHFPSRDYRVRVTLYTKRYIWMRGFIIGRTKIPWPYSWVPHKGTWVCSLVDMSSIYTHKRLRHFVSTALAIASTSRDVLYGE